MRISWAGPPAIMVAIITIISSQVVMVRGVMGEATAAGMEAKEHINSSTEIMTIATMSVIIKSRGMEVGIGTTASIERLPSISLNRIKRIDGLIRTIIAWGEITTTNTNLTATKTNINNKTVRYFLQATRTLEKVQKSAM